MESSHKKNDMPQSNISNIPVRSSISKRLFVADSKLLSRLKNKLQKEDIDILRLHPDNIQFSQTKLDIYLLSQVFCDKNDRYIKMLSENRSSHNTLIFYVGNSYKENHIPFIDRFIPAPVNDSFLLKSIKSGYKALKSQFETDHLQRELFNRDTQLQQLSNIGQLLMLEKDTNTLLNLILYESRRMTSADAGSLYLVEKEIEDKPMLRFILTQNDSISFEFQEFTMPITRGSISGFVADTGKMLNIPDVYDIPEDSEYSFNKSVDKKVGYRGKSMLVIPLVNHKDEVIGVIQLINRKKDWKKKLSSKNDYENEVIPFSGSCVEMVRALAGHAAISIENNLLYRSIERLFEGFVNAAITAIESRDPTTHGHSGRVALLTVNLAETVDKISQGPLKNEKFTREQIKEIRYASLLHDFGKVGVRENVLLKSKKLYPFQLNEIHYRVGLLKKNKEIEILKRHIDFLRQSKTTGYKYRCYELETELHRQLDELDRIYNKIVEINEPTVLLAEQADELHNIAQILFADLDNTERTLLQPNEFKSLSIGKGSLDEDERFEIESHVTHTFKFLNQVPWTNDLQNIPEIAFKHHEKLNGGGYPNKVTSKNIPIQSKMTAADRSYKKAVPFEKALNILNYEVEDNHIDENLVKVFIEAEIYKSVLNYDPEEGYA